MERRNFLRLAGAAIALPMLPAFAVAENRPDDLGHYKYTFRVDPSESEWQYVGSNWGISDGSFYEVLRFTHRTQSGRTLRVMFIDNPERRGHLRFLLSSVVMENGSPVESPDAFEIGGSEESNLNNVIDAYERRVFLPQSLRTLLTHTPSCGLRRKA